ncbi:DNA cytosine methyltransferase [Pseudomonas sp. MWU13-2105]|uniref:DNA cytosine methyltransferase n=1 Tax=Pseudomonas sp. MWU13-2105 TaxID=2935074 RepID=UPI0020100166|nr:DNA cytosine methyltransferase [Pseudomonas sp. MWU13-2105]
MQQPTLGSLFAGIGGFDVGFENAGYRTAWQVELNPVNRAVLADRFPHARQFEDVRQWTCPYQTGHQFPVKLMPPPSA